MTPEITIVIPVYNEGEGIRKTLESVYQAVTGSYIVLAVYDRPEDTTLPVLEALIREGRIPLRAVRNLYGRGALNAIRTGMESAGSEFVVVTMADLSDPPEVINDMVRTARNHAADIVCGSRYMRGGSQKGGPLLKGMMSRFAGLSLYHLAGLPTHDPTNSFKLYRKSFLAQTAIESSGGFELGIELVVKAWKRGYRVMEVPTSWQDRSAGESHFRLWKWLPCYLRWYFAAFRRNV